MTPVSTSESHGRIAAFLAALESGRRAAYVNLASAVALAVFTAVRFVILVHVLSPTEYGILNVYTTLASVLPLFATLGISAQYQRIAHYGGTGRVRHLLVIGMLVSATTLAPTCVVVYVLGRALEPVGDLWSIAIAMAVISSATALMTFVAQILIGRGHRGASAILMFLVNGGATFALVPNALLPPISAAGQIIWWGVYALVFAAGAWLVAMSRRLPTTNAGEKVSLAEGLTTIPAQVGQWLFIFVIRYLIGLNIDGAAITNYAMAATVADMAFQMGASLQNYTSIRVMTGAQSPWRGLRIVIPFYIVLAAVGTVAIAWILPIIGREGYHFPFLTGAILGCSGVVRLYINGWKPRAIGLKRLHHSSWAFMAVTAASVLVLALLMPRNTSWYAVVTLVGFLIVALVQRWTLNVRRPSESTVLP